MQRRIRPTAFTSAIAVLGLCAAFGSAAQSLEPGTPLAQAGKADISTPTAAGRIEAVVLKQGYGMGYGGAITLRYAPAVLLRDGSYTTDVDSALQAQPRIDGRWRRDGGGFELIARDGKRARVPAQMRARPADPGATLAGAYRSLSGAGGQNLHVAVVAAWKNLRFARDGSVRAAQGAGADAGNLVTGGSRAAVARYRLDGHTIALTHPDGRTETRLFYFFPDSDNTIGLGADTLSARP